MPDSAPHLSPQLTALLSRASVPPRQLAEPGPDEQALELAVAAALRAPDHGGLKPWRFVFISGEARSALGEVLAAAMLRRDPETPPERLDMERSKPLRSPLVVVAGAALRPGHKIPLWEQEAAAAAGTMNLLNALDAQGFGAIWLSSAALLDPEVKAALGFAATDALLGWIYVGTPKGERPRPQPGNVAAHMRHWDGA